MKKRIITLMIFCTVAITSYSQTFNMRTNLNDYDYIAVQLSQETLGSQTDPISSADDITNLVFTVRWLQSLGDVDLDIICTNYNITESGTRSTKDTYYYQSFSCSSPLTSPDDYTLGVYEDVALLEATFSGSTSGTFEIAPSGWATSITLNVEWNTPNPPSIEYTPSLVTGACDDTPIPTIVYDLVWTGAGSDNGFQNEHSWALQANWGDKCGGAASGIPTSTSNCFIPSGLSNYPENVNKAFALGAGAVNNVRVQNGASINFGSNIIAGVGELLDIAGTLKIYGTFTIQPLAKVTVDDNSTYIDAAASFVLQANADGVGSFIDNGTITYGGSGTALVQTYLTGSGSVGVFDFHCVGPTVDITGTGVTLAAFNVVQYETFAYKYDEPSDDWVNYSSVSDAIPTAKGIGLAIRDGSTNTMEMTGELKTGAISSEAMTTDLNGSYLLSNPYPSSVFWDDLYSNNSANVNDKVYVYDGTNYLAYNTGSGGIFDGYLQVGQGFFVEATGANAFTFDNGDRHHSNSAFYKSNFTNRLDVRVSGNESTDGLLVHFYEGAVSGYEANEDVAKKMSYSENATQFWTVLDDGQQMSINAMPLELLGKGMQSVPMSFICSVTGEYTMNFLDMESFEMGTEIWLEDKQVGGDWVSINDNPDYTFTASPDDLEDRFVIHFFGPTGVDEFGIKNTVEIYSYRQHAFVRNNTNEVIKKINIYTLSGELLQDINSPDLKLNKYWVSDKIGYYVVRVITDKNVYTNKVFISK